MRSPISKVVVALLLVSLVGTVVGGCARQEQVHAAEELDSRLINAVLDFGLALHRQVIQGDPGENVFLSPASVAMALHMTLNGAEGSTKDAMMETLRLQDMTVEELNKANSDLLTFFTAAIPGADISMANSLWAREGVSFNDHFLEVNREFYRSRVEQLDFDSPDAPAVINSWVEEETRGLIEEIIEEIEEDAVLFLINALYFKGSWTHPFDPERTREGDFYAGPETVGVPMMNMEESLGYLEEPRFQAVRLPYGQGRMSMYVFLPGEDLGLEGFLKDLTPDRWRDLMGAFGETEVNLSLPRFQVEFKAELSQALESMGMGIAFQPREANFGRMRPIPPNLFIGTVNHRAVVDVNEEGTEAAAATSVEIKVESAGPEPTFMKVDRPFFFAIQDDLTGMVLFTGTVVSP